MSRGEQEIVCRRCQETISLEAENCPHCGASIRSVSFLYVVAAFGVVIAVTSLFQIGTLWVFGLVGLVLTGTAGYLLYDRRQRIQQVAEEGGGVVGISDRGDQS